MLVGLKYILGPLQLMTQGYFEFYNMRDPRIVGSVLAQLKRHVCASVCSALRQVPKHHVCVGGMPNTQASTQAPHIPKWFFFNNNNSFLKFINDNNNSSNF
jgi:hypothetical protein